MIKLKYVGFLYSPALVICIFLSLYNLNLNTAETMSGNGNGNTFQIPVGPMALNTLKSQVFIGANNDSENNQFALAVSVSGMNNFIPLALPKVTLNGDPDQDNPLNGAGIKLLNLFGPNPISVKNSELDTIYWTNVSNTNNLQVYSLKNIKDYLSLNTPEIIGLATNSFILPKLPLSEIFAAAAVTNSAGLFDGDGSGIRLLKQKIIKVKNQNNEDEERAIGLEQGKIIEVSKSSVDLKINSNLNAIEKNVDMHVTGFTDLKYPDLAKPLIYIGLQVQTGVNSQDGARSLFIANYDKRVVAVADENNKNKLSSKTEESFSHYSIAPTSAFDTTGQIVGGLTEGGIRSFSLHKVRSLNTSTHLSYLVVVGGQGEPDQTRNKVFALPILNQLGANYLGQLANVNSPVVSRFSGLGKFLGRGFSQPANNPEDLYTESSVEAIVGGGVTLPGDINDIQVNNDTIYVSVGSSNSQGGMFYSRAIFDDSGKVKLWTNWKRTNGPLQNINNFAIDLISTTTWTVPQENPENVLRSFWSNGTTSIEKQISEYFDIQKGGAQRIFNLPYNSPSEIVQSLTVATGLNRILILELNSQNSSFSESAFSPVFFDNLDIGSIVSAAIVSDGLYNWLAVGGSNGIALLSSPDGTGWLISQELTRSMINSMQFKKISSLKNIISLSSVNSTLYALSPTELHRFILSNSNVVSQNSIAVSGTSVVFNHAYFNDLIATPQLLIVGTTNGLLSYNISNNSWNVTNLPQGVGSLVGSSTPVSKLYAYTATGFDQDLVNFGNLYVVNGYQGWHRAQVYRFEVANPELKLLPDLFLKDQPAFFVDLGNYYNSFFFDGSQMLTTRSRIWKEFFDHTGQQFKGEFLAPVVSIFRSNIRSGQREIFSDNFYPALGVNNFHTLGPVIRSYSSGAQIVSGDFGIRFNS